jgi:hypothetical protein
MAKRVGIYLRVTAAATQVRLQSVWNWTAQHNEVAMLLFVLIPWILLKIFTSTLSI